MFGTGRLSVNVRGLNWRTLINDTDIAMQPLKGNYPVLATAWADDGRFDSTSQSRLIDWLIDSGAHGLVMQANASEGHAQSDAEKGVMSMPQLFGSRGSDLSAVFAYYEALSSGVKIPLMIHRVCQNRCLL